MAKRLCAHLSVLLFVAACGTSGVTRQEALEQFDSVGRLNSELEAARKRGADVLVPEGFEKAEEQLRKSLKFASSGKRSKAIAEAEEGLHILDTVKAGVERARKIMENVMATRQRAQMAGAPNFFPEQWDEAEANFRKASMLIADGKEVRAMELRTDLVRNYSQLELRALKNGSKIEAKIAIENAIKSEAEEWAPITLKLAKEELKLVTSVLDADRTQIQKATGHAERAAWLAGRAIAITHIARMFRNKDYTPEQIVLWYQKQLAVINRPLKIELPFNEPNDLVVENLEQTLASLYNALKDARKITKTSQERITKLEKKISSQQKKYQSKIRQLLSASRRELVVLRKKYADELSDDALDRAETEAWDLDLKERYETVKNLFERQEATVMLTDNSNVLITVHSMYFSPGDAEIKSRNFALMNKIITGIQYFPESKILISGHTDAVGNEDKNLTLSLRRAQNVQKFLTEVGGIPGNLIESNGFGESKPVANNSKRASREKNRRIEVLIINEPTK